MADYHSIIAKAVRALDPNTGDARRRLYDRARGALLGEMRSAELALDQADILAARMALEEAIGKVETEAQRSERAQQVNAAPPRASPLDGVVVSPGPPANHNGGQDRGLLTRLWGQVFGRVQVFGRTHIFGRVQVFGRTQVFGRAGDRIERVEPHIGAGASGHSPGEPHPGKGRDTWLTELLARASREEGEDDDQAIAPRREIRRSR
jgi:hypothetical protein